MNNKINDKFDYIMSEFPIYLKYSNEKNYFKIHSLALFDEVFQKGKCWDTHSIEVKTLPDRNFLEYLLNSDPSIVVRISESEFNKVLQQVEK